MSDGKLKQMARQEFINVYQDVLDHCKIETTNGVSEVVCDDAVDKFTAFQELAHAHLVFKAANEMGL